ncbi:hypothetical protein QQG55_38800 [Brugia pahangi]
MSYSYIIVFSELLSSEFHSRQTVCLKEARKEKFASADFSAKCIEPCTFYSKFSSTIPSVFCVGAIMQYADGREDLTLTY